MKTGKKLIILFLVPFILFSQNSGYLSQKLMVENNIRDRIKDALSKIIDSHKYVINVDVELEVLDEVNEQITVFTPREKNKKEIETPAERTASVLQQMQQNVIKEDTEIEKESYSIGLPIPGFEVDVSQQKSEQRSITQSNPISPKTMKPIQSSVSSEENEDNKELVDKVVSRKRPSRAQVKRMDIALILQEGAAPELIENIRQLTMASSKFDRNRGDKITIMTASFKERRDQKSAEQIMLKNIAEKIENLEQKRIVESGSWKEDIEKYKTEQSLRREQDLATLENAMAELEKKRLEDAAEYEKKELMRRDSIRNSKLENEIKALKEMLTLDKSSNNQNQSNLDSSRFAMLDNELQSLQKTLFQAMSQDSSDAARRAQAKIESEIALREQEKKAQDSLIQEKLLALDAAQAELVVFQEEAKAESGSSQMVLYILSGVSALLLVALIVVLLKNKKSGTPVSAPMPPWMMYPPPRPPRRKKRKRRPPAKQQEKKEQQENQTVKNEELEQAQLEINNNQNVTEQVKPQKLSDDPNVLKSEIDDIRKSVVSMSVGQPGKTSTIVQEWLEQPAPAPEAEPEEISNDEESDDEESDDE
ncbi:MAG: hypothetical protein CMF95_06580 [Candidatus Marinimicrobia bacterium]|nr:hypothetical protein [Candidatus Neomarinimicrobiota bacterium]